MSLRRYPAYRPSGNEWLAPIPVHWQMDRLKRRCDVFPSTVDKKSVEGELPVRLCNYTDVYYNDTITPEMALMPATATPEQVEKFTLRAGDTVFTKDSETADDIGIAAYVPADMPGVVCGYHLSIARPRYGVNGAYVKRMFDAAYTKACFAVRANGLTRVGLNQYAVDNVELPWPPIAEQEEIVAFLKRETTKIDTLIAEQEKLLALLAEKRQATISHAVTRGLDPAVRLKDSGIPWLGQVPVHWDIMPLARITLEKCDGPFGSGIKSDHYTDEGALVIRLQNIRQSGYHTGDAAYLDIDYFNASLKRHSVAPGDLLIAGLGDERNLVGRACVAPDNLGPALVKADCFRFRLIDAANASFVAAQLNASASFDAGTMATGTTRSRIPLSAMGSRVVALPPWDEQTAVVAHIDRATRRTERLMSEARDAIALLGERRAALITAAVTGQIDVRGAAV